ncbi:MAG: serine protease, partial [Verrucomicrobiota bacterium]
LKAPRVQMSPRPLPVEPALIDMVVSLRRIISIFGLLSIAFFGTSCVVMPANTHWDQKRSLAKYDSIGIDAPVRLPELDNQSDSGFSAADYLTLHSGLIVSGEYIDEEFKEKLATSRDSQSGVLELGFSVPIAKGGSGFGSCAPISSDGYFLTAAHVLAHEESFVLYATSNSRKTYIDYAPVRVVYRNDEADFAIVKARLSTPRYLKYRRDPLTTESTLFAGGWMHEKGGGLFLEEQPLPGQKGFQKIVTTLPMIKGDSGSPLIDQKGRICGVLSTMRLGVIIKMKPKSTAVMLDPSRIDSIIRRDRGR